MTETLSIKVPLETKARLRALARDRRTSPSALVREALEVVLAGESPANGASLYEKSRDLFEELDSGGPPDLSANPEYLNDLGK